MVVAVLLLGACSDMSGPGATPTAGGLPQASPTDLAGSPPSRPPLGTPDLESVPPGLTPEGALGEVPEHLLEEVIEQAAALAGVEPEAVQLLRAERAAWPDGALGCPQPGEVYPQEPVDGYWIVVQAGDKVFDFRLSETGTPRLCPSGGRQPVPRTPAPDY